MVFVVVATAFCVAQVAKHGCNQTFEYVKHDRHTLTYKVDGKVKMIYLTLCYLSMSTREMEWTNSIRKQILARPP